MNVLGSPSVTKLFLLGTMRDDLRWWHIASMKPGNTWELSCQSFFLCGDIRNRFPSASINVLQRFIFTCQETTWNKQFVRHDSVFSVHWLSLASTINRITLPLLFQTEDYWNSADGQGRWHKASWKPKRCKVCAVFMTTQEPKYGQLLVYHVYVHKLNVASAHSLQTSVLEFSPRVIRHLWD